MKPTMEIEIISEEWVRRGKLFTLRAGGVVKRVLFTFHALDSMKDYRFKVEEILKFLINAEEVVKGHSGRFVAHKALNGYIVRIVYEYENRTIAVITLYVARKERYWKGGVYEDKILP